MRNGMFHFIHAADLHIDSPLRGLESYDGAPAERLRGATRQAFMNLVDLAIRQRVQFIILATSSEPSTKMTLVLRPTIKTSLTSMLTLALKLKEARKQD